MTRKTGLGPCAARSLARLREQHECRKRHGDDARVVDGRPVRPRDEQSKRGAFGRLFDERPDAPCVAHGIDASPVVDLYGDLLVADLQHEVQVRFSGRCRHAVNVQAADDGRGVAEYALGHVPRQRRDFWTGAHRVGCEGNPFLQPAGAERVVRQAELDGVPWAIGMQYIGQGRSRISAVSARACR